MEKANAPFTRYGAGSRLARPRGDGQKRRFAGPVAADQTDAFAAKGK